MITRNLTTQQSFVEHFLSTNPSIDQIAVQAQALEDRAEEHLEFARKSKLDRIAAAVIRHTQIAIEMRQAARKLRAIVIEAAEYLAVPDWAYEADEAAMHDADRAHSQLDAA